MAQPGEAGVTNAETLTDTKHIVSFVEKLETRIHTAKLGGLLLSPSVIIDRNGDVQKATDKPELHKMKQLELYHFIADCVLHSNTLAKIKVASIKDAATSGKLAFDELVKLKTRAEADIVGANRARLLALKQTGMRDSSEKAFDEFFESFEAINLNIPVDKRMKGEELASYYSEVMPSELHSAMLNLRMIKGDSLDDPDVAFEAYRSLARQHGNLAEAAAKRAHAVAFTNLMEKIEGTPAGAALAAGKLNADEALAMFANGNGGRRPTGKPRSGVDNKGAVFTAKYAGHSHSKMKHVARRHFFIRELVQSGVLNVSFISTNENVADLFTKALPTRRFEYLRDLAMNIKG